MRQVCSTPVVAVAGVPVAVPRCKPGSHPGAFTGVGGPEGTLPVAGPCPVRDTSTGSLHAGLRAVSVRRTSRAAAFCSLNCALVCPLVPRAGHTSPPLLCTVLVACTVPAVGGGGGSHCGRAPGVPPSVRCVVLLAGEGGGGGVVGSCPCGRAGGQRPRTGLPGCGGCSRTAVVLPLVSEGGVGVGVDISGHVGGPAGHRGACRCSQHRTCAPVVAQARPVADGFGRGVGLRVRLCWLVVVAWLRVPRFGAVGGLIGRFLPQSPQGTS